jgi:Fe-S-cluster containining protein
MDHEKACIEVTGCGDCLGCCDADADIAGFLCGYDLVKDITHGVISPELVKLTKIYRVPKNLLDDAAKFFRMFPTDNLLKYMTLPQPDGSYEFLVTGSGRCTFLGPRGCIISQSKPLACALFPYYVYKLQLHFNYSCPGADRVEIDLPIREQLGKMISQFLVDADRQKTAYRNELDIIKQKFALAVVQYERYYPLY